MEIASPLLSRLATYWSAKRDAAGGALPARAAIDPFDFPWALGHVFILDIEAGPPRTFRYRVTGTRMTEATGFDLMGRTVDEIPDGTVRQRTRALYEQAADAAAPISLRYARPTSQGTRPAELVVFPLADDGVTPDRLMVGFVFLD